MSHQKPLGGFLSHGGSPSHHGFPYERHGLILADFGLPHFGKPPWGFLGKTLSGNDGDGSLELWRRFYSCEAPGPDESSQKNEGLQTSKIMFSPSIHYIYIYQQL